MSFTPEVSARYRRNELLAHEGDEVVRTFLSGHARIVKWWDRRRNRRLECWRYSLIVGDEVVSIGAFSEREAVRHAWENRRFVAQRDSVSLPRTDTA